MGLKIEIPRVAFLGVCNRSNLVRNVDPRFHSLNILGLRKEVISTFFPILLNGLKIIIAIFDPASTGKIRLHCSTPRNSDFAWWDLDFQPVVEPPSDPIGENLILISQEPSWNLFVLEFPKDKDQFVIEPDQFNFFINEDQDKIPVGKLDFYYARPQPLTEDRIAAIKSDPQAIKVASLDFTCNECKNSLQVYTALDKKEGHEKGVWYQDLPERFICECGKTNLNLAIIRESFHSVLGEKATEESGELNIIKLYEATSLDTTVDRFSRLIDTEPEEAEVQTFLEQNTILFQKFTPWKILKKAPIFNKFNTDFAILSKSGELFLIEIERPGKKILREDGDRTKDFNHPFDQVHNWLDVIKDHRVACLEMMGLKNDSVTTIRGVVIFGRDKGITPEQLRRVKSTDFGAVAFMTYDDLLDGFKTLIREMKGL